jgi:hypothetical protein
MTKKKVSRGYPSIYGSKRAFQRMKRRELKELKRAIDAVRLGCAYMPAYEEWKHLEKSFNVIYAATRPGVWK